MKKKVILSILVGVVVGLVAQWGVAELVSYQKNREIVSFLEEFKNSPDKSKAIRDFLSTKKGLYVEISKGRADDYCDRLEDNLDEINNMLDDLLELYGLLNEDNEDRELSPEERKELSRGIGQLRYEYDTILYEIEESCRLE